MQEQGLGRSQLCRSKALAGVSFAGARPWQESAVQWQGLGRSRLCRRGLCSCHRYLAAAPAIDRQAACVATHPKCEATEADSCVRH